MFLHTLLPAVAALSFLSVSLPSSALAETDSVALAHEAQAYFSQHDTSSAGETAADAWLRMALDLQNKLDYQEPLATATFVMTHNSYNAAPYRTQLSYVDPNQKMTITHQLDAGVRSLELDVHRFFSMSGWPWQWRYRLMLCHGQDNHLGCSPYDRPVEAGLDEVATWLHSPEHQKEVIVIYIEDHTDARQTDLASAIATRFGDRVYRPAGAGCQGIPMHISKQAIVDAGKQVLLMGGGDVCTASATWKTWAYAGVGDQLHGYPTGEVERVDGVDCDFSRDFYDRYWVRFYEDRTLLSSLFAHPDRIDAVSAANLEKCGANLIGFDKLTQYDSRLNSLVWSWDQNQPAEASDGERCAFFGANGRFAVQACTEVARYACHHPGSHEWRVTQTANVWSDGQTACETEFGAQFVFAVPTNGYDNEQLRNLNGLQGSNAIWLNLHSPSKGGAWQVNAQ